MQSETLAKAVLAVLVTALFAYSLLVVRQPLLFVIPLLALGLLYLLWRLVRAVERVATTLEARE